MQSSHACRHCIGENVLSQEGSYASALFPTDLATQLRDIEEKYPIKDFLTFVCVNCTKTSIFSFEFHRLVTQDSDLPSYKTAAEYYRGVVARVAN